MEQKYLKYFKSHNNILTQQRINPLSRSIETNALIIETGGGSNTEIRPESYLYNRNLYYPLYFMFHNKTIEDSNDESKLRDEAPIEKVISSKIIEFRVCSDRDKLEKFFDKPFIISFGSIEGNESFSPVNYVRFLSKAICIYPKNQNTL